MDVDIPTLMLLFFILFLIVSIWKIWAFLPNKQLQDDDTTEASQAILTDIMLRVIKEHKGMLTNQELFEAIKNHKDFDQKHFWRLNLNKVDKLLKNYYLKHPQTQNIQDIYKQLQD